eukprot:4026913-Amphidinium_carterae.2
MAIKVRNHIFVEFCLVIDPGCGTEAAVPTFGKDSPVLPGHGQDSTVQLRLWQSGEYSWQLAEQLLERLIAERSRNDRTAWFEGCGNSDCRGLNRWQRRECLHDHL